MATLIKTDGTIATVHPKAGIGEPFADEELREYVGDRAKILYANGCCLYAANEDGLALANPRASLVAGCELVGDVLACDRYEAGAEKT